MDRLKKIWIMLWIISPILVTLFSIRSKLYDALFSAHLKHLCKPSENLVKMQTLVWWIWVRAWNSIILTRFLVIWRVWSMGYTWAAGGFGGEHRVVCSFFFIVIIKVEDLWPSSLWLHESQPNSTFTLLSLSIKSQPSGTCFW